MFKKWDFSAVFFWGVVCGYLSFELLKEAIILPPDRSELKVGDYKNHAIN